MAPRIAIPMPHSTDHEYGERAIPQYERAVALAGGVPVRILLDQPSTELRRVIGECDGVLLPGSNADVNPARFKQEMSPQTVAVDLRREAVDDLLLEDAYNNAKPVLGICYGLQSLNVFRNGSLIQHIPDFLPDATRTRVNHEAGRTIPIAHTVEIEEDSLLEKIVSANGRDSRSALPAPIVVPVNSSHHQSARAIGEGLRIVARCPDDGIIEAVEGTSPDHFVLAVQWHPERSVDKDEPSRAIFRALVNACS
ncbi:MAG TPA: gamma-glutamyl-gamma-aminobutyrate hydrolase family protein [Candidatus Acidoferrum sp.]|jgi:putative glutamine amidotransferase|nr:gamma-glutamyl-gamma-aminobutyrate hydrolase family protein [Candidatus Acidoferrum sp.]